MMIRREFVEDTAGAVAGVAFVACGLQSAAPAQAQSRRREVVINGRRVKTVDVHAHCAVPEAMALMGLNVTGTPNLPTVLVMSQAADRLRAMDEQGIDVEALSINPGSTGLGLAIVKEIVQREELKLSVTSEIGRGTMFDVAIPAGRCEFSKEQVPWHESR